MRYSHSTHEIVQVTLGGWLGRAITNASKCQAHPGSAEDESHGTSWSCQTATEKPNIPGRQPHTLLAFYCLLIQSIKISKQPKPWQVATIELRSINAGQESLQLPTPPATNATLHLHPTEPCPACWICQSCDWSFVISTEWARLYHHPIPLSPIHIFSHSQVLRKATGTLKKMEKCHLVWPACYGVIPLSLMPLLKTKLRSSAL